MMDIPPVEELYEIRRRLAEQHGKDVSSYAAMLQLVSRSLPGVYVNHPLLPKASAIAARDFGKEEVRSVETCVRR